MGLLRQINSLNRSANYGNQYLCFSYKYYLLAKKYISGFIFEEDIGFEPMGRSTRPLVFKTSALVHSANPPLLGIQSCRLATLQRYDYKY